VNECPMQEDFARLLANPHDEVAWGKLEVHLATCSHCRHQLDTLAGPQALPAGRPSQPLRTDGRSTLDVSSPRASLSASAREVVCSTGRKRTIATRKMPPHRTAICPYAEGPSVRAARTWNAYVRTPETTIAPESSQAPEKLAFR